MIIYESSLFLAAWKLRESDSELIKIQVFPCVPPQAGHNLSQNEKENPTHETAHATLCRLQGELIKSIKFSYGRSYNAMVYLKYL